MSDPKIGASIMICAGLVCTLYVMMLSGSMELNGFMSFPGVTYTVNISHMNSKMRFGWLGVYGTLDGKGVSENGLNDGSASWFSYNEEKWGLSKSDSKTKDMWKGCSRSCPSSFLFAVLGLVLSSAIFTFQKEEVCGAERNNGNSAKLARRTNLKANWIPFFLLATLCTLCGVAVVLVFGLGCYRHVTAEAVGVSEDVFEVSIGGGFVVAIIATCLSMVMMVLVFVHRSSKLGTGEVAEPRKEATGGEGTQSVAV